MTKTSLVRHKSYAWLLLNTLVWGAAFIVSKPALEHTSSYLFMFYRMVVAGAIMLPYVVVMLRRSRLRQYIPTIIAIEFIGNVLCLAFLYEGLARSTAIETSLLATTVPIFIIGTSLLLLHETQTRREWIGFYITLFGMLLITFYPVLSGQAALGQLSLMGNFLIICANILTGIYVILAKKYYKGIPKLFAASMSFIVGIIAFGLVSFMQASWSIAGFIQQVALDWQQPAVWFAALYMGIFGSVVGLTAYIKGQDGIEASEAGLFYYLHPLVYIPLGIWLLKEPFSLLQIVGLALILGGVFYAQQPFARRRA